MAFEDNLHNMMSQVNKEKSFIDKVLARDEVVSGRQIIREEEMGRRGITDLLNLCSSNESKLWNYGRYERYYMAKYFVWIREFVSIIEQLYDYRDDLKEKQAKGIIIIDARSWQLLENCRRLMEHNVKFLVDLYFNLARTTVSINMSGFREIITNRFEMGYSNAPQLNSPVGVEEKKGGFLKFA
jgi:hypothetical protein